jgi:hypothetical protein
LERKAANISGSATGKQAISSPSRRDMVISWLDIGGINCRNRLACGSQLGIDGRRWFD